MNLLIIKRLRVISVAGVLLTLLAACGSSNNNSSDDSPAPTTYIFEVTMRNLTAQQPMLPFTVIAHNSDYALFTVGTPVTTGLEYLAEGGDGSFLIDEVTGLDSVYASVNHTTPVGPGGNFTLTFEVETLDDLHLSTATMLVNTNDAISGINGLAISGLSVGESMTINAPTYDTGTEANTEAAGTIPGPADGGEGFNADRSGDIDMLLMHGGVVTADDGLAGSVLTEIHRWDNPAARFTVTRTQ